MLILGIESSCDETAAAVVCDGRFVLSNVIASQHELHEEYGGVVPEIASRAHVERILPVVRKALAEAGVSLEKIDAVAVGHRPGLIGSLLVGVAAAKALAWSLGVPLVGVDHVHAHLWGGFLEKKDKGTPSVGEAPTSPPPGAGERAHFASFPALGLVVSGGHTVMYRCDSALEIVRLGGTIDDAIGEAYDKVATLLGLGHPGGPALDALAKRGNERAHEFPLSRLGRDSLDFSFSGLKTSVLYRVKGFPGHPPEVAPAAMTEQVKADIAASFQRAAVGVIVLKLERALARLREEGIEVRSLLVGGGVSANLRLREELKQFASEQGLELRLPAMEYCMDNAAMLAGLAWHRVRAGLVDDLTLAAVPTTAN